MNNFYFSQYSLVDFAGEFVKRGGKVLLIDQVFKLPDWSHDLRTCYERYPQLKTVFTGSSVMRLKDENPELNGIVKSYNLRGFSFREFLNLQTGNHFSAYTLDEILHNHEHIVKQSYHTSTRSIISRITSIMVSILFSLKKEISRKIC